MQNTFISLDLETTGLDKRKDKIIEFGAIKFSIPTNENQTPTPPETFRTFINPNVPIPEFITHITNITNEDVKDAPTFEEKAQEIQEFIGDLPIIGHFISFDTDFLRANGLKLKNHLYDTSEIARIFIPGLPSYSLEILSDLLHITHTEKHRALDDSIAAQELFLRLIDEIKNLPPNLFAEIKSLCKKSSWEFAEVIETLEQNTEPAPARKQTKEEPAQISTIENQALEEILKDKKSKLIELPSYTESLVDSLAEKAKTKKEKTLILLPHYLIKESRNPNKIGRIDSYISTSRLEIFKNKESFKTPEITALIKTLIWLGKTENGLLTEDLSFSPDEREILSHIQADNDDTEPFAKKALEIELNEKVILADHSYLPTSETDHLIIFDLKTFIFSAQNQNGNSASLKTATRPIKNLKALIATTATPQTQTLLTEIIDRLEVLFGIMEAILERNTDTKEPLKNDVMQGNKELSTKPYYLVRRAESDEVDKAGRVFQRFPNSFFPQPLEITPLETASSNWQKLKELSQSLITTSHDLASIITKETLPHLKQWKEALKSLQSIFVETNLKDFHVWIQKNRDEEVVIRKIPISLAEYFKTITAQTKYFTIIDKSIDSNDDASITRSILGIQTADLIKIKPDTEILKKSQIHLAEDIPGQPHENLRATIEFIHEFIKREKGRNVFIFNSIAKLEQALNILAPKLKKEGFTLLAQKSSGGTGKILELYKASPETTSILFTPNMWERFYSSTPDFKNIVIQSIPFDPPSDQYMVALSKNFQDAWGGFSLPSAALSLKKMIGKFFSKTPGHVIILDSRVVGKSYSSKFISTLGDFSKPEQATVKQLLK